MTPNRPRVVAVVVAWNRQELMVQTLDGLDSQTRPANAVVVIDNASTDDSAQIAKNHPVVDEVLTMPRNLGGAGGFAAGIARAVNTWDADFVWIMDDDTVPTEGALEALLRTHRSYPGQPAVLASKAVWTDGREHPMNRPRPRPLLAPEIAENARKVGTIPIRTASFVSIMIDRRAIEEEGLPKADYFLWNDDFEYTSRLLRNRIGLYVPASVVVHKTKKFGDSSADPGPRFVNEVRNKVWMYSRSDGLNPLEKVLYGGKSVLRWGKTIKDSEDSAGLITFAKEGFRQAISDPKPTTTVLADTPVAKDVEAIEGHNSIVRRLAGDRAVLHPTADGKDLSAMRAALAPIITKDQTPAMTPLFYDLAREKFTVLTSVYAGDDPAQFERALESITRDQTMKPNQVVLVQDGPVPADLKASIDRADEIAGQKVDLIELKKNVGLADALQAGLQIAKYDIIARADADDVSLPYRFEKQIPLMENHDLIGSAIAEFKEDENEWGMIRVLPTTHEEIAKVARFRDPFNHPTVVMRRSALEVAGGYRHLERMEDYWLFARMIDTGARTANIAEPLVAYRVGAGAYSRRGGLELLKSELELQRRMRTIGFTTPGQYARNIVVRAGYRLIPTPVRKALYTSVGTLAWFRRG